MLKALRIPRNSVLMKWFISYAAVLMIPLIISIVMYSVSIRVVETQTTQANEKLLKQIQETFDNRLRNVQRLSVELTLNTGVTSLNTSKLSNSDNYTLTKIISELQSYKTANDFIDEIYIYYKANDTAVSTKYRLDSKELYDSLSPQTKTSYDEWIRYFNQQNLHGFFKLLHKPVNDDKYEPVIVYYKPLTLDTESNPGTVVFFVIKESQLLDNIQDSSGLNDSSILVLDSKSQVIASAPTVNDASMTWGPDDLAGHQGVIHRNFQGEESVVSYIRSAITGWIYISVTSEQVFQGKAKYVQRLTLYSVLLCLIVGFVTVLWSIRRNYNPIQRLIRGLSSKTQVTVGEGKNEYSFIEEVLKHSFEENEAISIQLRQYSNSLRSYVLLRLLKGSLGYKVPQEELLQVHDIVFAKPSIAVVLFQINQTGKFNDLNITHFIMANVFEELLQREHIGSGYTVEVDNMLACIVNMSETEPSKALTELNQIISEMLTFVQDQMKIEFTASVSGFHNQLSTLPVAFIEAMEAMEYGTVIGNDGTIFHDQVIGKEEQNMNGSYYYPLGVEQQLINFIKVGDFDQAKDLLETVFENNKFETPNSVQVAKCLMFDLVGTVVKTLNDTGGDKQELFELKPIERVMHCRSIKEMQMEMILVFQEACSLIVKQKGGNTNRLGDEVKEFIDTNYTDPNLNVSAIGSRFGITPWYISKIFKEQLGIGILDYMNRIRIDQAKLLLNEQNRSLADIAQEVGYSDVTTFGRIFKKMEGITPGKYKNA
ncbi:helix-turn-helix domain-containing protein [Paenibacillus sp. LMG 31458]|uniref:Helix-turn-helix domain-containing protein n=1 Tax=Paenibacillus phytorum TaxID=2654977 RepID=A0ABX1XPB9_9BACL|nr:AraC family transcriptional regulator [Paenibacillus phytorum]NOU70390.1 helix-turn-helix domain-containing protein [Paenibacillus phytorum]